MRKPALLALEDGSLFHGDSIGSAGQMTGEVVFNTAMTGYQEILTDPSYAQQIITLTYPHIGNVGVNDEDCESAKIFCSGLVVRDLPVLFSSWRSQGSLEEFLKQHNVVGIAGIDTRRLTRKLREQGALNGCLVAGDDLDEKRAIQEANKFPGLKGLDLARKVTSSEAYAWTEGEWRLGQSAAGRKAGKQKSVFQVVAYDFGIKRNILRMLAERGCQLTVVPAQTPADEVLALKPSGIFLSNGPGDPEPCVYAIDAIRTLLDTGTPIFGICLGHQLLSLAMGARTVKMKFGHHGANHPVQDLASGQVMITSQNHGFAVAEDSLPPTLRMTHRSLFDGSLQGVHHIKLPAFGFQGHPEASPGPHDITSLFDHFIDLMRG